VDLNQYCLQWLHAEWGPLQDPAHWGDCLTTMAFRLKVSSVGSSRMNLLNSFDALLARNGKPHNSSDFSDMVLRLRDRKRSKNERGRRVPSGTTRGGNKQIQAQYKR
jgi:hypothetical protein